MTISSSSLTPFFLLLTFTTMLKCVTAGVGVKDIDGNILNVTSKYSILKSTESGGVVTIARNGVKNQLVVVLSSNNALPVAFKESDTKKKAISILIDDTLSINFTNIPKYNGSTSWIVVSDGSTKSPYVAVGSAKDYPGLQIEKGTFKIERVGVYYKLVFCSDISNSFC